MDRRSFLELLGGGLIGLAGRLGFRLEEAWGAVEGGEGKVGKPRPLKVPIVSGSFQSRFMQRKVEYVVSGPPEGDPKAVVLSLYGLGGTALSAFLDLELPEAAARVGVPLAIACADGGPDSYWHKRADGTDAHAMLVEEFVPLLVRHLGRLPLALHGWSMGGYGALLAAERGATAPGTNRFKGVAVSSPAIWTGPGEAAPSAFDGPADFYANNVFTGVAKLKTLKVRLDCGDRDPFYQATRELSARMTWPHVAVYRPGATHDIAFWRSVAPAQMRFLAKACGVR